MSWYWMPYGAGAVIIAYLTYRLYTGSPNTESKLYFSLMGLVAGIWVTSEFFYYLLWGNISLAFYLLKFVGIALTPYAVLMSVLTTPIRSKLMRFKYTPLILLVPPLISIFFVLTSPFNHLFFVGFKEVYVGDGHVRYEGTWGPVMNYLHVPYSYFCLLLSFAVLVLNIRKLHTKIDYYLVTTLFIAVIVPVVANVIVLVDRNIYPDPTSLTLVFSAAFMAYMLSRYKLFKIPTSYEKLENEPTLDIESNRAYLIYDGGYNLVKKIANSKPSLIISTRSTQWIQKFVGRAVPVIWLSEVDAENSILPERLEFEIEYTIIEFWRQNPSGIVILEGITYIRAFNSVDRVLMFLKDVIDVSSQYDGGFVLLGDDVKLLEDEVREKIEGMFDEKMSLNDFVSYGIFSIKDSPSKIENALCVTSENPDKVCPNIESIWVRRGGEYSPDTMRMDVLYEIENALKNGKRIVLHNLEGMVIGWKTLKLYAYMKLLADLAEKSNSQIIITGRLSREDLKAIVAMLS